MISVREILEAISSRPEEGLHHLSLSELVRHIVSLHHRYLREALPTLSHQLARLEASEASRHPELVPTRDVFRQFAVEMQQHMEKEEKLLFPLISTLEDDGIGVSAQGLKQIIETMEHEHENSARDLATMRTLTRGFEVPPHACDTYRSVMQGLADLEEDTHLHVLAENEILFPKAIGRARSL
jgi:regulator of cell morphogenesis and NO signaling